MYKKKIFILLFAVSFAIQISSGCTIATLSRRDPSKKGYLLGEKMIRIARYHDGILLHKVNANFFQGYPYAEKSAKRILELNALLRKSLKGRSPVEIISSNIVKKNRSLYLALSVVNNTEFKINQLTFKIMALDLKGRAQKNSITGNKYLIKISTEVIGGWDIINFFYLLKGFQGVSKAVVLIQSGLYFNNKPIKLKKK